MSLSNQASLQSGDEATETVFSFGDIVRSLWYRRWLLVLATAFATALAITASYMVEKQYEASILIAPVSDDSGNSRLGALGSLASSLGGLASIAGLQTSGNDRKSTSLAILQSDALGAKFISENNLLPIFFADKWDATAHRWVTSASDTPTIWKGNQFFKRSVRRVTTDSRTNLSTLTVTWRDPNVAAAWANRLVSLANDTIRERTIEEGERNIAYLNEQFEKTNIVAVQNSVGALLENEIKKIMLARGRKEYAFEVIDPAVSPERASYPNRTVWTMFGGMLGFVLASAIALSRPRRASDGAASDHQTIR